MADTNVQLGNTDLGGGIGCFFIIIAIAIFLSAPRILDIINVLVKCHK